MPKRLIVDPPLNIAGENLPLAGYLIDAFSVISSLEAYRLFSSTVAPCRLAMVVPQAVLFGVAW